MGVVWSDESPFVLRFYGRRRVWKRFGEGFVTSTTSGTVKHDAKLMVWGCFSAGGVGDLFCVSNLMNAASYKQILIHHLFPSTRRLFPDNVFLFAQDNDPKHKSNVVQTFLHNKGTSVMEWPSYSPDLNPIENLWAILDKQLRARRCNTLDELFKTLQNGWNNLQLKTLQSLVASMPARCQAVIDANGYPTKY